MKVKKEQPFVVGIDIGGTSITACLYPIINGKIFAQPVHTIKQDTAKGVEAHIAQIAGMIEELNDLIPKGGRLMGVGIGSPGRFRDGRIMKGTNPNMGKDSIHEFDDVDLGKRYTLALNEKGIHTAVAVRNDADAMMAGMLDCIRKSDRAPLHDQQGQEITEFTLRGKTVGMFGIGTGIGNSFVRDEDGVLTPVTDGHASKLLITVDEVDIPVVEEAKAKVGDHVVYAGGSRYGAEGLFSATTINALAGVTKADMESGRAGIKLQEREDVLQLAGKYMARTIEAIHSGESEDIILENGWNRQAKQAAARTSIYLIGGGIGSSPSGEKIIQYANAELKRRGIKDIRLVQMPPDTGTPEFGAATMIPASVYQQAEQTRARG